MEYIKVFFVEMPLRIHGATIRSFDNGEHFYTILLNKNLSEAMQIAAFDHEMEHINNHDFDAMIPADTLEALRHAG